MHRVLLVLATVASLYATADPINLYVGPEGSDDTPGVGWSAKRPYQTMGRALQAIGNLRADRRGENPIIVNLLPGTYRLTEPLVLDTKVAGRPDAPTVIRAQVKGEVVLSGAETVAGWQPWRDGIWQAKLSEPSLNTVYWDGDLLPAARFPNVDPERPRTGGMLYAYREHREDPKRNLLFAKGDLDVTRWKHPETGRVLVWPDKNWNCDRLPITGVNPEAGELSFGRNARYPIVRGNRFFVEHILEELDAPGEWFFDAKEKTLYLMPPTPGDPADHVSIPCASTIIQFAGTREEPLRHIELEGLRIEGSTRQAVEMTAAWNCTIRACEITRAGTDGIVLGEGSSENRIVGCDIAWTGTDGIRLNGVRDMSRQRTDGMHGNVVENCHIHHVGQSHNAGGAIDVFPYVGGNITHDNIFRRNEIHDAPRKGIMFGGVRNVVEGNHIHHVNLEQSDTGPIGMCTRDLNERGSIIKHNYIHDVGGYNMLKPGEWAFPSFCWGIYLDDWTSGVQVVGNVVVGAPSGAVHVHSGVENVIENNVLIDSPKGHILFSPILPPKEQNGRTYVMADNVVRRNIVSGAADSAWLSGRGVWQTTGIAESNHNLLWFEGVAPRMSGHGDASTWEQWQALGYDKDSVVARRNPVRKTDGRYEVDAELAKQIGFEPIPWDQIGTYESPDRYSWPVRTDWPREEVVLTNDLKPEPVITVTASAPRLPTGANVPVIDGTIGTAEWQGSGSVPMVRDHRDRLAKPGSTAHVFYDDKALYIAFDNPISQGKALSDANEWGKADAVEVALRASAPKTEEPVLILHAYLNGRVGAASSGGMSPEDVATANKLCQFGAKKVAETRWTAEVAIPWSVVPGANGKPAPLQFNLTCRKVADSLWIMWKPTGRRSYGVGEEGKLIPAP
jgi:hypothetical protein